MLTIQEFFDQAMRNMAAKPFPCSDSFGECLYEMTDSDGIVHHCAIGDFIPAGHQAMQMRETNVDEFPHLFPELKGIAWPSEPNGIELAMAIQHFHDSSNGVQRIFGADEMQYIRAEAVAKRFGLDDSVVSEIRAEIEGKK